MRRTSANRKSLEVPRKSVELQDPGARELASSDEEYFSDASEGRKKVSRPVTPSSPIPTTRVERVDDEPRHGEVPGTDAYEKRKGDAVPDEVEVVPEGRLSKRNSRQYLDVATTPGGTPLPATLGGTVVPRMVVEKVDPSSPSYGEVPGTEAYKQRLADATPDVVLKNPDPSKGSKYRGDSNRPRSVSGASIPETIVTRVDDTPAHGEVPGTKAAEMRQKDATPDQVEISEEEAVATTTTTTTGSPTPDRSETIVPTKAKQSSARPDDDDDNDDGDDDDDDDHKNQDDDTAGFGDDFDDFEEGAEAGAGDDDFGDFDDFEEGIEESAAEESTSFSPRPTSISQAETQPNSFLLLDSGLAAGSLSDLLENTKPHFDAMFPSTTDDMSSSLPTLEPIPADSPVFPSQRSRSLWKQLVTPPPLQPPNWTQSRIRRLFLISLGVPVDLDEILPPSKQKKLVLPDIDLPNSSTSGGTGTAGKGGVGQDSISRLKDSKGNDSTGSLDSQQSAAKSSRGGKSKIGGSGGGGNGAKAAPPPPSLDLAAVKRICATTDEKLSGVTDEELQAHVEELSALTESTRELLEYWLKRRDGLRKEKEAFEGVIENLVRHAKRVRTIK